MQCNLKVMNQQKCREQQKLTNLMVQIKHLTKKTKFLPNN